MKKALASFLGATLISVPAIALASNWQTVQQLTAIAAALKAQQSSIATGQPLACAALFSAPSVKVGQHIALAWGSVGAVDPLASSTSIPMWSQNGSASLTFTQSGTWTYDFTFYSADNASTTCAAKIVVTK